jgi:hypothetical protein
VFFMARLSPAFSSYVVQNEAFCIERDASVASTGWHGLPPPRDVQKRMVERYRSGKILEDLVHLLPVPYVRRRRYEAHLNDVQAL